jgi:hypothetical protein
MEDPPVGAHVWGRDPLAEAAEIGVDRIQLFLSNPQGWEKPPERDDAAELIASPVGIYVHAPYLINVCSPKPNVRYGSRKILADTCAAAAEVGALAVIVHPGHAEDGIEQGVGRWTRTLEMLESDVPVYLENTAGASAARIMWARTSRSIVPAPMFAWRSAPVPAGSRESLTWRRSMPPVIAITRSTASASSSPAAWAWQVSKQKPISTSVSAPATSSQSRASASKRRATAWSPPAVFSR